MSVYVRVSIKMITITIAVGDETITIEIPYISSLAATLPA